MRSKVVRVEQPSVVLDRDLLNGSEDRHACIVDPGMEAAELPGRHVSDSLQLLNTADVGSTAMALPP